MRVIVFHSYKGGVGRTLALANFAYSLAQAGKRVLMLDMDFDAPGLPYKFQVQSRLREGYVDYLMRFPAKERTKGLEATHRVVWLRNNIIPVDSHHLIRLLPAGNPTSRQYWGQLAQEKFLTPFLFQETLTQTLDAVQPPTNIGAVMNDLEVLNDAADKPDYLLVDCRGGADRVAVPLFFWADTVVSMFAAHEEGLDGTAWVQRELLTQWPRIANLRRNGIPSLQSVLCRVPQAMSDATTKQLFKTLQDKRGTTSMNDDSFCVLREYRGIEATERLVLESKQPGDLKIVLSHDYYELFHTLAPEIPTQPGEWKTILGLAQNAEILERWFELHAHTGQLTNVDDNEPNVALRNVTIRRMIDTIYAGYVAGGPGQDADDNRALADTAFYNSGCSAGRSFGAEMMQTEQVWRDGFPQETQKRLDDWCEFDSRCGFGRLSAVLASDRRSGTIEIQNNFLIARSRDEAPVAAGNNQFMRGYVTGVLEYLLGVSQNQRVEVTIKGLELFEFRVCQG